MKSKDYELTVYADGVGTWHAKATFTPPLGNTGKAERIFSNARTAAWRNIRSEILLRQPRNTRAQDLAPIRLEVKANDFCASNHCHGITWAEKNV
jgi:hypothetical protein